MKRVCLCLLAAVILFCSGCVARETENNDWEDDSMITYNGQQAWKDIQEFLPAQLHSLVGKTLSNQDNIRMVPDILQSGEDFFFPVFTTAEEMGEYGQGFSKIEKHFLEAANLARYNEKNVAGIVMNAFTEPFIIPRDLFDMIAEMPSAFGPGKE